MEIKEATSYQEFDPDVYYSIYRASSETQGCVHENSGLQEVMTFVLDALCELFDSGSVSGDRLLDVGTGASLMSFISASRHVKEIHLTDLLPRNLDLLQKWREGEDRENDFVEYVLKKENDGTVLADRLSELRRKITDINMLDVTQKPSGDMEESFDIITSSFCLEVAAKSAAQYTTVVENIATLVKPGGYMVLAGTLGETHYVVGKYKFWNANLKKEDVNSALKTSGFSIVFWRELTHGNSYLDALKERGQCKSFYVLAAKRGY